MCSGAQSGSKGQKQRCGRKFTRLRRRQWEAAATPEYTCVSKCALLFPHSLTIKPQTLNISSLALLCTHFPCWVPGGSDGEVSTYSAGDRGSIPGLGRSPGGGNGNPLQYSCLENPMDCSLPGSSIHGIFQARILEWVAISSPGDLPNPGIEPRSPSLQADTLPSEPPGKP